MKKTSFILVVATIVTVLFGCGAKSQLAGSTFTNEDIFSYDGGSENQSVTIEFAKDGTGTLTSILTHSSGGDSLYCTYSVAFSWIADGNIVNISGGKESYKQSDGASEYSYEENFSWVASLEKKELLFTYGADFEETNSRKLGTYFNATYYKWVNPNYESHGSDTASYSPFMVTLTKN